MNSLRNFANLGSLFVFVGFLMLSYGGSAVFLGSYFEKKSGDVLASCTSDGAYGQTCVSNERFEVEKKVK